MLSSFSLSQNHPAFSYVWRVDVDTLGVSLETIMREFGGGCVISVIPAAVFAGPLVCTRSSAIDFDEYVRDMICRK